MFPWAVIIAALINDEEEEADPLCVGAMTAREIIFATLTFVSILLGILMFLFVLIWMR
jgi:hypothetical protein